MEAFECQQYLCSVDPGLLLDEALLFADVVEEFAVGEVVKDEVEAVCCFKLLVHFYDEGVVQLFEDDALAPRLWALVQLLDFVFLQNFDCVLLPSLAVLRVVHHPEGALADDPDERVVVDGLVVVCL